MLAKKLVLRKIKHKIWQNKRVNRERSKRRRNFEAEEGADTRYEQGGHWQKWNRERASDKPKGHKHGKKEEKTKKKSWEGTAVYRIEKIILKVIIHLAEHITNRIHTRTELSHSSSNTGVSIFSIHKKQFERKNSRRTTTST